jgi:hypothetical protein
MGKHQKKSPELSVGRCSQGLEGSTGNYPEFQNNYTPRVKPSVTVNWQPTTEVSPNWRKLWHLLLAEGVK